MKLCLACQHEFDAQQWRCPSCHAEPERVDGYLAFAPELAVSNDGYDSEHFGAMPGIDDEHFLRRARNRLFVWAFGRFFADAKSLLEIGSGIGVVLRAFRSAYPELQLSGTDIYSTGLRTIEDNVPGATVLQVDARRLPYRKEFDVVAAFDTIEHIDDDEGVLQQMRSATRPGGGVMISVPQHPFLWSQRDVYVSHKRRYTRRELVRKVEAAGFEAEYVTSFVSLPFPAMALAALRNRKPRADYDPFEEFRIGPIAAGAMNAVLSVELQLLKLGISFPFGGTLFLVGRRSS